MRGLLQVVGKAIVEGEFADGHAFDRTIPGVDVGISHNADVPARRNWQCVDADSGFLLWRHGFFLLSALGYKPNKPL